MTEETKSYYMGRNDYWNGFKAESERAGKFSESYLRGYRHARSEDDLSNDEEWD